MNIDAYGNAMAHMEFDEQFELKTLTRLSGELQKRNRRRTMLLRCGIGFAACAAAVTIAILIGKSPNAPPMPHAVLLSPTPSANASAGMTTPAASADTQVFVVASDYESLSDSYIAPQPGQVILAEGVRLALKDPQNAGSLFFVQIDILPPEQYVNSLSEYVCNGRSISEWRELVDLADGTYPYREYNGDHGGNISKEQWEAAQAEARTLDSQHNYDAAVEEYNTRIAPMLATAKKDCEESELTRLQQLDYNVLSINTWDYKSANEKEYTRILAGLLSADQLQSFAADPSCGYFIDWVHNGDGIVNWDETLTP